MDNTSIDRVDNQVAVAGNLARILIILVERITAGLW